MKQLALAAGVLLLSGSMLFAQNPVADQNAQKPQSHDNKGKGISGRWDSNAGDHNEKPVTTTGSAGQTTPGYQTEAGVEQAPGGNSDVPHTASATPGKSAPGMGEIRKKTIRPPNPQAAGQNAEAADINAQAARRAEIEPGHTQGVNGEQGVNNGELTGTQSPALPQADKPAKTKHKTQKTAKAGKSGKAATKSATKKKTDSQ
jgi:hypothetical protein